MSIFPDDQMYGKLHGILIKKYYLSNRGTGQGVPKITPRSKNPKKPVII